MPLPRIRQLLFLTLFLLVGNFALAQNNENSAAEKAGSAEVAEVETVVGESSLTSSSIFARAWNGGIVVFVVLMLLILMSIGTWGVCVTKFIYLGRVNKETGGFIKSFWESRSLNELNNRLGDYAYSPAREVFRSGYAELVRASQIRDQAMNAEIAIGAAVENMTRSLMKAKMQERRKMERFLPMLAISASSAPFIGLFGTVWGIMGAFEGIARTGSASLAAVAPGISEALIATAFGLAAAIPAVIGYNLANGKIRGLSSQLDGFSADFLNIVERYLVTDRAGRSQSPSVTT